MSSLERVKRITWAHQELYFSFLSALFFKRSVFSLCFFSQLFGLSGIFLCRDIVLFLRQEIHQELHLHPTIILCAVALLQTIMVFCLGRPSALPRESSITPPETQCANESDPCRERYGARGPGLLYCYLAYLVYSLLPCSKALQMRISWLVNSETNIIMMLLHVLTAVDRFRHKC